MVLLSQGFMDILEIVVSPFFGYLYLLGVDTEFKALSLYTYFPRQFT